MQVALSKIVLSIIYSQMEDIVYYTIKRHKDVIHVCLSVCLSACLTVCLCPSVRPSVFYLSVHLPVCLFVCLSVCLSVCMYVFRTSFFTLSDHPFSTYAKFSEELTSFTPWYAYVVVYIKGEEIQVFRKTLPNKRVKNSFYYVNMNSSD